MGGRGSSSASKRAKPSTTAWQDMVAEMDAAAPASDYDHLESRIPDWFLDKTFTFDYQLDRHCSKTWRQRA